MLQPANPIKASALWFTPLCDEVYRKIAIWDAMYWIGEIHSTRKWVNPTSVQVEDKPTRMAHDIPFREIELDHLVRIVEALRPNSPLAIEVKEIKRLWKFGRPLHGYKLVRSYWSKIQLPSGIHRTVTVAFYPEHVKEILAVLNEAKAGQKDNARPGKDLFEE